jgi:hypothetical protein
MQDFVEIGDYLPCWADYDICCKLTQGAKVKYWLGHFVISCHKSYQEGKGKDSSPFSEIGMSSYAKQQGIMD